MELEFEKQWIEAAKEKDKLEHELKVKTIELEMLKLNNNSTTTQLPVKLKLQPYNQIKEDIITYLLEFENLSKQMKWTEEVKILQLRSLLVGETREVSQQTCKTYDDLRKTDLVGNRNFRISISIFCPNFKKTMMRRIVD